MNVCDSSGSEGGTNGRESQEHDANLSPSKKKLKLTEDPVTVNSTDSNSKIENGDGVENLTTDEGKRSEERISDPGESPAGRTRDDRKESSEAANVIAGESCLSKPSEKAVKIMSKVASEPLLQVPAIFRDSFDRDFNEGGDVDDLFKYYEELVKEFEAIEANSNDEVAKLPEGQLPKFYEPWNYPLNNLEECDSQIINEDVPERLQLRHCPVTSASDEEIKEEAKWIYHRFFRGLKEPENISKSDNPGDSESDSDNDSDNDSLGLGNMSSGSDSDSEASDVGLQEFPGNDNIPVNNEIEDEFDDGENEVPAPDPVNDAQDELDDIMDNESDVGPLVEWESPASPSPSPSAEPNHRTAFSPVNDDTDFRELLDPDLNSEENVNMEKYVPKITKILELIRNSKLEVPFIYFYRRVLVEPTFSLQDLWLIYDADSQYQAFLDKRNILHRLFKLIKKFQDDRQQLKEPPTEARITTSDPIPMDPMSEKYFEMIPKIKNMKQLESFCIRFSLYRSQDITAMLKVLGKPEEEFYSKIKHGVEIFTLGIQLKLHEFVESFGLARIVFHDPEKFRDRGLEYKIVEPPPNLTDLCSKYICPQLPTTQDVLQAAKILFAIQLSAEHTIWQPVFEGFLYHARINVHLTADGKKMIRINPNHPLHQLITYKDERVGSWDRAAFLKLIIAEKDGLLRLDIGDDINCDAVNKRFILDQEHEDTGHKDTSRRAEELNFLGGDSFRFAVEKILFPRVRRKIRDTLTRNCTKYLLTQCSDRLSNQLWTAPPKVDFSPELNAELEVNKGLRVVAVAYKNFQNTSAENAIACSIGPDGNPADSGSILLPNLTKYTSAKKDSDRQDKAECLRSLQDFITKSRPHIIVVGGESKEAIIIQQDLRTLIRKLHQENPLKFPTIQVEIRDATVPKIYASSQRGQLEFPHHSVLMRQAISLGRLVQDPLVEFAQLWTPQNDILSFPFCALQDHIPREQLLEHLYLNFVTCVTRIGVDINRACFHESGTRLSKLVPFISGLGNRKAEKLLKAIKESGINHGLQSRSQLTSVFQLGPVVYENCVGSIKMDMSSLVGVGNENMKPLDGTRIHPSDYRWALSMAIDAVEPERDQRDAEPDEAAVFKEVFEDPEKLNDLALDAFLDALESCGGGNHRFTMSEIKAEFMEKYREIRRPYHPLPQDVFWMLTKETPETFFVWKTVTFEVEEFIWKKTRTLRDADLSVQEGQGLWTCKTCWTGGFSTEAAIQTHIDEGKCPENLIGISGKLSEHPGITGFIHINEVPRECWTSKNDKSKGATTWMKKGATFPCNISKIQFEKFSVVCTTKPTELWPENNGRSQKWILGDVGRMKVDGNMNGEMDVDFWER